MVIWLKSESDINMGTSRVARTFLGFVLSLTSVVSAIKDATSPAVDPCSYPGMSVVLAPNNAIICNAVLIAEDQFIVPEICGAAMNSFLSNNDLNLYYGDNAQSVTIPKGSSGALNDGIYTFVLPGTITDSCNQVATMYDSMTMQLDLGSCEVVGYGSDSNSSKIFDATLNSAQITKSTSSPCCDVIRGSLTSAEKGVILTETASFNCLTSSGATCGSGDLGAPVYCKTDSGTAVLTGLTSSTPCVSGGTFLVHDLTAHDTSIKFGF
ncbi:hypothetical protein Btru_047237 [Bulinus truncatus]|nr:hypothetical protein Btru_047237 [Bulinus truncatus]